MQGQYRYCAKGFDRTRLRLKAEEVGNHFYVEPITPCFLNYSAPQFALARDGENDFIHEFCAGDTCEIADSTADIASDRLIFIEKP